MWGKEGGGKGCDTLISHSKEDEGLEKYWLSRLATWGDEGLEPKGFLALNWQKWSWI